MTADPQASPAVARRRVRLALRKARQGKGLSQADVAAKLEWSLSKVQRIESGEVSVSGTDLRALAILYGSFTAEEVDQLLGDTRVARRQRWWTAPEYRQHLSPGLIELLGFEAEATRISAYQPMLVPGVLQTPAAATFILDFWDKSLSEDDRRVRNEVRVLRRQQIIEREDAPTYRLIIDESVLERDIGGPQIAAEQMDVLAETAQLANVHIRVLPLDKGGLVGLLGPFMVVNLAEDDDSDDAVLYRESFNVDSLIHDVREVRQHRSYFDALWRQSLAEDVSLRMIEARAAVLRSELDRFDT